MYIGRVYIVQHYASQYHILLTPIAIYCVMYHFMTCCIIYCYLLTYHTIWCKVALRYILFMLYCFIFYRIRLQYIVFSFQSLSTLTCYLYWFTTRSVVILRHIRHSASYPTIPSILILQLIAWILPRQSMWFYIMVTRIILQHIVQWFVKWC